MASTNGTGPSEVPAGTPAAEPAETGAETGADTRTETPETPETRLGRMTTYRLRLSYTGAVVAVVLLMLSMTPSLLPRGPLFQGAVSGASAACGYMIGVFLSWAVRYMFSRDFSEWRGRTLSWRWWAPLGVVALVGFVAGLWKFREWQNEVRDLVGESPLAWTVFPVTVVVAALVFLVLVLLGQGWGTLVRTLYTWLGLLVPPRIARVASIAVVIALTVFLANGVVAKYSMQFLNASFAAANDQTSETSVQPTSEWRSGGPESLVSWESLGREGRTFVSHGPSTEQLEEVNGSRAVEPIRSFVGLGSGDDLRANAALAAEELVRAGGLGREIIAVGSATGSGWINQATVDSLEYMYNGNIATVSMQYSYLPSWLSFLVDSERARQAGVYLFEAVDAKIRELPENRRPKIVVFGESLGSFGAEAAFGTIPTLTARTDGALFVGPTFNNDLWREATDQRDAGSPERLPVYDNGEHLRFAAEASDLEELDSEWNEPRVVYLQHASDPITWWSPDLIFNRPDWLSESRGPDVLDSTQWIPLITFLQVSADMAVSTDVPDGHGHTYISEIPRAWAKILEPVGWTGDEGEEKLEQIIPLLSRSGSL
ncbi:alpha/beta hydrolase [Corynebacterium variabile]|uniref:Membrane protein n=1 Tax=Corynebacterium variabile TaxID=1727 RepID=A0A4Y4C216_9CORY|nr:alpha/beta-hydrolase family protein [Corynebacterium variabile]GEC85180.1 membrane protein [Corynebacterium variabile]